MHIDILVRMANDIANFFGTSSTGLPYEVVAGEASLEGDSDGHDRALAGAFERAEGSVMDPRMLFAATEAASHLRRFWDPRMRAQIIQYEQQGAEGLNPIARTAVRLLAEAARTAA
jgi:hypothetical protein